MKVTTQKVGFVCALSIAILASFLVQEAARAGDVAAVTDASGTVSNLKTLSIECPESGHGLRYQAPFLDAIYKDLHAIPLLQQDGSAVFAALDRVKEFTSNGKTGTLTLLNGKALEGKPLSGCRISGDSALGRVTVPLEKVRTLKLNGEELKKSETSKQGIQRVATALKQYNAKATVLLRSGKTIGLQNMALVYEEWGHDTSWLPPKSYTTWKLMGEIPVKYGESAVKLSLTKIQSLEVSARKPSEPKAATTLHVKTTDGQEIDVTVNSGRGILPDEDDWFTAIGFLGITEDGYAHVPFLAIKSLTLGATGTNVQ